MKRNLKIFFLGFSTTLILLLIIFYGLPLDIRACSTPFAGMIVNRSMIFCPGRYEIGNGDNCSIVIENSDIHISGDRVTLVGDSKKDRCAIGIEKNEEEAAVSNISLSGLTIEDFGVGIYSRNKLDNVIIENVRVENIIYSYIDLGMENKASSNLSIVNSYFEGTFNNGIILRDCMGCSITDNQIVNKRDGIIESSIVLFGGSGNLISNNSIFSENDKGCNAIWLDSSNNNTIQNNTLDLGYKDGSHFVNSNNNLFVSN
ncbi:MAG: right-handed parallel beta-helix repeat-containing protein, partial [Candidatus Alcyoniella australis]|nr:right-handed parallel beta-helix repeat-containing protein [Candidatus Alcyoniella australis]